MKETFEQWKARILSENPSFKDIKDSEYDFKAMYEDDLELERNSDADEYELPKDNPNTGRLYIRPGHKDYETIIEDYKTKGFNIIDKEGNPYVDYNNVDRDIFEAALEERLTNDKYKGVVRTKLPGLELNDRATNRTMMSPYKNSLVSDKPIFNPPKDHQFWKMKSFDKTWEGTETGKKPDKVQYPMIDAEGNKVDQKGNPYVEPEYIAAGNKNNLENGVLSNLERVRKNTAKANTDNLRDEMINSRQPTMTPSGQQRIGFNKDAVPADRSWLDKFAVKPEESTSIAANIKTPIVDMTGTRGVHNEEYDKPILEYPKTEIIPESPVAKIEKPDIANAGPEGEKYTGKFTMPATEHIKDEKIKKIPINDKTPLSLTSAASIVSGVGALANAGANIYGAIQASKATPVLAGYRAPVEPTLVTDKTEHIKSAAIEQIDKAFGGIYDANRRYGRPITGDLLSKQLGSINELSSKLAEQRMNIDATNANATNQFRQYNDQTERQRDQFNVQTQNQFDQNKANIISQAISGAGASIASGAQSIMDNMTVSAGMKHASIKNDMNKYESEMTELFNVYGNEAYIRPEYKEAKENLNKLRESEKLYITKTYGK